MRQGQVGAAMRLCGFWCKFVVGSIVNGHKAHAIHAAVPSPPGSLVRRRYRCLRHLPGRPRRRRVVGVAAGAGRCRPGRCRPPPPTCGSPPVAFSCRRFHFPCVPCAAATVHLLPAYPWLRAPPSPCEVLSGPLSLSCSAPLPCPSVATVPTLQPNALSSSGRAQILRNFPSGLPHYARRRRRPRRDARRPHQPQHSRSRLPPRHALHRCPHYHVRR